MSQAAAGDRWTLRRLLSEVIGSGPKSAEDMTREQARAAFDRILDGAADPTTLGAFFLANRWKRNTPEELAAYLDIMRDRSVRSVAPTAAAVDCGANYDGKRTTALLGVGAAAIAAAAGTPISIHSGNRIPTHRGCAYKHVLDELGVATDIPPERSAAMLDDVGVGFYYQPRFNPGLHELLPTRERMGVRTFLNTIETLANPSEASIHLGSFYHLAFAKKVIETVQASETLSLDRVIMFQGVEGYDEVRPGYTKVAEWRGGEFLDYEIETANLGLDFDTEDLAVADVAADSARITREVLRVERDDHFADATRLNAAFRLYAGATAGSLEEGLELARHAVETGDAAEALARLRSFDATA